MTFITPAPNYDVVVVGDVATDVIIRLHPDGAQVREIDGVSRLVLPLGEKVAIERNVETLAGGAAANAAVCLARLGFRVGLASFLAHDHVGLDLLNALHTQRVDTRLVRVDTPAETTRNFVLNLAGERTILVRDGAFHYHWPHLRPNEVPAWMYLTSLGAGAAEYEGQIAEWLAENPGVRLALSPGTFQVAGGPARLAPLLERAELLFCEETVASALTGTLEPDPLAYLDPLARLGPGTVVVITHGGGAVAVSGARRLRVPPYPDSSPPFDRTGASDAAAASVFAALASGVELASALRWGPVNFMAVSHELGSQDGLLRLEDLQSHLGDAASPFEVETV